MRELDEEVGVSAEIIAFNRHVESIVRDGERRPSALRHRLLRRALDRGEARTSEEADAVLWVDPRALGDLPDDARPWRRSRRAPPH